VCTAKIGCATTARDSAAEILADSQADLDLGAQPGVAVQLKVVMFSAFGSNYDCVAVKTQTKVCATVGPS
jgi:hypothetical protein